MNGQFRSSIVKKPVWWISVFAVLALVLVGCASTPQSVVPNTGPTAAPATSAPAVTVAPTVAPTQAASASAGQEATINVATDAKLGKILVDGKGMTLYMFTKDTPDKTNCSANCLKFWPALITQGSPTLGSGVDASLIGSTAMADGSKIVTYNHMPLYTYAKDKKPGDVVGQGNQNVWYVVAPDGTVVGYPAAAATPASGGAATSAATQPAAGGTPQATAASTQMAAAGEATINVVTDAKLGKILVDGNGMTLYMFTKDTPDKTNCSANCLKFWPALVTQGSPTLGPGVDAKLVGNTKMADGSMIVTYNHMPLYTYAKDTKPGDVVGQGNQNVWYVVSPDGIAVGNPAAAATPAATTAATY